MTPLEHMKAAQIVRDKRADKAAAFFEKERLRQLKKYHANKVRTTDRGVFGQDTIAP